jgi:hypothetical protein
LQVDLTVGPYERIDAVGARMKTVQKQLADVKERFRGGFTGPQFQVIDLAGQLQASTSAPTEAQLRSIDQLTRKVTEGVDAVNALLTRELTELQKAMTTAGVGTIAVKPVVAPEQ